MRITGSRDLEESAESAGFGHARQHGMAPTAQLPAPGCVQASGNKAKLRMRRSGRRASSGCGPRCATRGRHGTRPACREHHSAGWSSNDVEPSVQLYQSMLLHRAAALLQIAHSNTSPGEARSGADEPQSPIASVPIGRCGVGEPPGRCRKHNAGRRASERFHHGQRQMSNLPLIAVAREAAGREGRRQAGCRQGHVRLFSQAGPRGRSRASLVHNVAVCCVVLRQQAGVTS